MFPCCFRKAFCVFLECFNPIQVGSVPSAELNTGCPIIKFTLLIYQFLSPLILLRDCSVQEIYVLISPFKRTMFDYSSIFTFRDMKNSIEYPHFVNFYTPNFDAPEKLKYFKRSWIKPYIILFGVYMFLKMGNMINFCFLLI